MQIQAAVVRQPRGPFSVETVELDAPQAHETIVRIAATGMCHTDLSVRAGHLPFPPRPCVLGHEGAGVVESVGSAVTQVRPGDRVVMSFAACGACDRCLAGEPAYCRQFLPLNLLGRRSDGSCTHHHEHGPIHGSFFGQSSFATHALVEARNLVKVPDDLPLELLGPLGCGMQTGAGAVLNHLRPAAGSSIAVFGAGAVGLAAIMAAKVAGCGTIVAIDVLQPRLDLALELGATHSIRSGAENVAECLKGITGGGVQHSVEATGIPAVMAQAVELLAKPGKAALLGVARFGSKVEIDALALTGGNTVKGVIEGDAVPAQFIPQLIELYRKGQFPFDRLVRYYTLDQINQAAEDAESGVTIKPIIRMP